MTSRPGSQIGLDDAVDPRAPHLDGDAVAGVKRRAMHLRDRGRGDRLVFEHRKELIDRAPSASSMPLRATPGGRRRQGILQSRKLGNDIGRQQIGVGAQCLAKLDERRSQRLDGQAEPSCARQIRLRTRPNADSARRPAARYDVRCRAFTTSANPYERAPLRSRRTVERGSCAARRIAHHGSRGAGFRCGSEHWRRRTSGCKGPADWQDEPSASECAADGVVGCALGDEQALVMGKFRHLAEIFRSADGVAMSSRSCL